MLGVPSLWGAPSSRSYVEAFLAGSEAKANPRDVRNEAPVFHRRLVRTLRALAPADPQVDREADAPDCARPRALADDAAAQRSPRANAAHRADSAAGPADPLS